MVKKNCPGCLKLLLSLLSIMLLGMFSTCYASVSEDYIEYGINNLIDNGVDFYNGSTDYTSTVKTFLTNNFITNTSGITQLTTWINDGLTSFGLDDLEDRNIIIFVMPYSTTLFQLFIIGSNVSSPNNHLDLGYLFLSNDQINTWGSTDKIYYQRITVKSSSMTNDYQYYQHKDWLSFVSLGQTSLNSDITVYNSTNVICAQLPSIYLNYNGSNYPVILQNTYGNYYPVSPEPDVPSGDFPSGDSGDSGENIPNFIDYRNQLNDINNNISTSSNNIIQNNNENTERIINSISGETNKIINNITNTNTDVNVSGEFSNMLSSTDNIVDPTINFFSWLLDNIRTVLNSTGDYDLNVTLFDKTYTIRSDFFKLPDGDLKTFLQSAFLGWFAWRIIKKIRYIVYAIKCVNISSALNSVDFNPDIL